MMRSLIMGSISVSLWLVLSGSAAAAESAKPTPPSAESATVAAVEPKVHVVESGESLSMIAEAQQLESWRPLWNANPELTNPDLIYAGQKLTVPVAPTTDRPLPAVVPAPVPASVHVPKQRAARPAPAANYAPGASGILERIRMRESGGNYATNTGNGYYGAYQFDLSTWRSNGGTGLPSEASPAEQDMRAQMLYERRGCSPWPNTCY